MSLLTLKKKTLRVLSKGLSVYNTDKTRATPICNIRKNKNRNSKSQRKMPLAGQARRNFWYVL